MRVIVALLLVALAVTVVYAVHDDRKSTSEIDQSLQQLNTELRQAHGDDALYSGGLIKALIALRIHTIKNTISMLAQKRESLLHRICLNYVVTGTVVKPASDQELEGIQREMANTQKEIERARSEDAKYSGGFVKALIKMRVETEQETLAGLNQRYLFAKYGLPNLSVGEGARTTAPPRPTVPDKNAL